MNPLVIYHANCWDGFCAAWVARQYISGAEYHPAHYGTPPPNCTDRRVYVLDFSYPLVQMEIMAKQAEWLGVLDHHKTAKEPLLTLMARDPNVVVVFDEEKSGGRLAWEHFFPNAPSVPWLVTYTEDRDLWRHQLAESEAINAALRSYPLDFTLWDDFNRTNPQSFVREGKAIRRCERRIVEDHVRNARLENFDGTWTVPIVNATTLFSEIAGELAKGHPFAACYFDRQDGKRQWSLRSTAEGVDVSVIAKAHGGGGHTHAAGFEE